MIIHSKNNPIILNEGLINTIKNKIPNKYNNKSKPLDFTDSLKLNLDIADLGTIDTFDNDEKVNNRKKELYSKFSKIYATNNGEDSIKDPSVQNYLYRLAKRQAIDEHMKER